VIRPTYELVERAFGDARGDLAHACHLRCVYASRLEEDPGKRSAACYALGMWRQTAGSSPYRPLTPSATEREAAIRAS